MFPISKKCGINRSLSHYPWSCPTTKQLLRLTALAKNMYKTARGVKTDTKIHLGRSKAIFLKHYHIEEIGQTILMGPQYDHSTHIFCRSISSSKDKKKWENTKSVETFSKTEFILLTTHDLKFIYSEKANKIWRNLQKQLKLLSM